MPRLKSAGNPENAVLQELLRREHDGLRLYRPLPQQVAAVQTKASEVCVRGGNRSGKSLLCAAIVASAARREPIIGPDDKPLPHNFPTNRPMLIWVIGYGEDHIGDTMYRLLFEPGQFKIIKDLKTGRVRAWRPWDTTDRARESECLFPGPLIPENLIKDMAWGSKAKKQFEHCQLTNGTIIKAYTSGGHVKMGDPVDLIWVDEDIEYPKYVSEWQARLSDKKGRFFWSAWPWTDNYALVRMSQRAADQRNRENPDVVEVVLSFRENPYIDEDEKRKRVEGWSAFSDDEVRSRADGEFQHGTSLMYPNFSLGVHGCPRSLAKEDAVDVALKSRGFEPPDNWTRYLVMDPGHAVTAILFFAIPPSDFGDFVVLYDELYLIAHDAFQTAIRIKEKVNGKVFEAFLGDGQQLRQSITGVGRTFAQQYELALAKEDLRSVQTAGRFRLTDNTIDAGIVAVRNWLTVRPDGTAKLRVVQHKCKKFLDEIQLYKKHFEKDEARDRPASGQKDHAMDALRYGAMHGLPYVPPPAVIDFYPSPALQAFHEFYAPISVAPAPKSSIHCGAGAAPNAA